MNKADSNNHTTGVSTNRRFVVVFGGGGGGGANGGGGGGGCSGGGSAAVYIHSIKLPFHNLLRSQRENNCEIVTTVFLEGCNT